MLNKEQTKGLVKQQYRFVGNHSAVKVCQWTKSLLRGKGGCYKLKFYGIRSHQCLQMTTCMFCANRCIFCWRGEKAPVSKTWYGPIDDPIQIIDESLVAQLKLLYGFKGSPSSDKKRYDESTKVRHVALSLVGEPIAYPKINEILEDFHKRKISTFVVTNAQFPEQIRKIKNVTQLYISLDAPTKEDLKSIDRPLFPDYHKRLITSLKEFSKKKFRKCIRLTLIKGLNDKDEHIPEYVQLIRLGNPEFVEVKGYVNVGASRKYLKMKDMPWHKDVIEFSKKLEKALGDYEVIDDHEPSRVACMIKKSMKGKRFIDFKRFFAAANSGKEAIAADYSSKKMQPNV